MFDWFFDFLYLLTKSIFRLIDGLIECTNYLCGIESVKIDGEETDLMTWILDLEEVETAFIVASIISIFLVVFFSCWGIIKAVASEKPEMTPGQVCVRAFKSVLTFMLVPFCMVCIVAAFNTIGKALYDGTSGGSTNGLGSFLVGAFAQDSLQPNVSSDFYRSPAFDYTNTSMCWQYFDLENFDYFYSWIAGVSILLVMAKVLFVFVDRLFSIVILYIIAPIPIAASVIDEGEYFKSWRDQIISKFVVGYGAILGINIYGIVVSRLAVADVEFFDNSFINFLFKIVIILGGAFALDRIIAMVGNIFGKGRAEADLAAAGKMQEGTEGAIGDALNFASSPIRAIKNKITGKSDKKKSGNAKSKSESESGPVGGDSEGKSDGGKEGSNKNPVAGSAVSNATLNIRDNTGGEVSRIIEGNKDEDKKKEDEKGGQALSKIIKGNDAVSVTGKDDKKTEGNKK